MAAVPTSLSNPPFSEKWTIVSGTVMTQGQQQASPSSPLSTSTSFQCLPVRDIARPRFPQTFCCYLFGCCFFFYLSPSLITPLYSFSQAHQALPPLLCSLISPLQIIFICEMRLEPNHACVRLCDCVRVCVRVVKVTSAVNHLFVHFVWEEYGQEESRGIALKELNK